MKSLTAIDLFAGGGGASEGLRLAGYAAIAAFESDPEIAATHHTNHPTADLHIGDVRRASFAAYAGVDHVHGSPPCQSFSLAASPKARAKRAAAGDSNLIDEWVRAIATTRPKTASMENVRGAAKAPSFRRACQELWKLGYWLNWDIYDAADFGVPQRRHRLIVRAVRDDVLGMLPIDYAEQTLFGEKRWQGMVPPATRWVSWYEAIEDLLPGLPPTEPAPWQIKKLSPPLRDLLINEKDSKTPCRDVDRPTPTVVINKGSLPRVYLVPRVGARTSASLPAISSDRPSPTIRALGHDSHWRQLDAWLSAGEFRQCTPRALARFQSFPDSFQLPDRKALAGKIVGNAVPPLMLARLLGRLG
jgi:DNA (cytosine-5)-methyltransferase 1